MATGSISQKAAADPRAKADKLIEAQLGKVRRHIRITDLIAGIMVLLAGIIAFLTVAAVIDHWLVGLGAFGRWMALAIVLLASGWHLVANVIPLLFRRINPAYAAQTIERGEPSLKNSLLNYLLLPRERDGVAGLIYHAVQQRAAADVSRVEVDQTVDRTVLIRAGYVLAAMMVVAGAYKILSPKDPFQTVRRIATPWADIARPARVSIQAIEPGDASIFQGETVELSAIVRGTRSGEAVTVTYSTVDKQIVNRTASMKLDSAGLRHVLTFPPESDGIQQDIVYHISAGDAMSKTYRLQVTATPVMSVESVEYEFPSYTRRAREVVERQGDLKAIEGTRVTVRTKANQPIKSATVEFFTAEADRPQATLPMHVQELTASSTWRLELDAERRFAKYRSYQARFRTTSGAENRNPVSYRIEVIPDLAPEIEFLTPNKETVEVPLSASQKIEIRAIDPDYGLTEIRLHATSAGKEFLNQPLLENSIGQIGQTVVMYEFQPREWKLAPGDRVTYWATAADNRATNETPDPNRRTTTERTIVIVPDPAKGTPATGNEPGSSEPAPPMPGDSGEPNADRMKKDRGDSKSDGETKKGESPSSRSDDSKSNTGERPPNGAGKKSDNETSDGQKSDSEKGSQKSQPGAGGQGAEGGDKNDTTQKQGGNAGSNQPSTSESGQGADSQMPGGSTPQNADGGAKPNQSHSAGSDPSAGGNQQEGNPGSQRTEPAHDGEVFEKALERIQREVDPDGSNGGSKGAEASDSSDAEGASPESSDTESGQSTSRDAQREKSTGQSKSAAKDAGNATKGRAEPNEDDSGTTKGSPPQDQAGPAAGKRDDELNGKRKGQQGEAGEKGQPNADSKKDKGDNAGDLKKDPQDRGAEKLDGEKKGGASAAEKKSKDDSNSAPGASKGTRPKSPAGQEQTDPDNPQGNNASESAGAGEPGTENTGGGEKRSNGERPMRSPQESGEQRPGDPAPPSMSEKSSNSEGQQSGDQSGGGKQGAGQSAQRAGNDNAGSNSPSDAGNEGAQETGQGDTTTKGDQQQSSGKTGTTGDQKGAGSKSRSSPTGKDAANENGDKSGAAPAQKTNPGQDSTQKPSGGTKSGESGTSGVPTGGGGQGSESSGGQPSTNEAEAAADEANLEYTRRATNMVLDYLKNQQDKPDDRLLEELGWTPEDLQNFLRRWEQLKRAADEDPAARRELDDTLRGLGLRPQRDRLRQSTGRSDDVRGLRESGVQSAPPAAYQEQFNAFKKGTSRATK